MPNPRFLAFVFAGFVAAIADISLALAQSTPPPAKATPAASPVAAPAEIKPPEMPDIAFYVARGDANACGTGCNEWIAADGKIDREAAQRLRKLVTKLGRRKLPIFFHSPGGSVIGSIELGRLIRNQKMAAAVARTIPSGCDRDKLNEKPCEALKRSGQDLASELDALTAMCNSGCVYALAGGSVRIIPPFVRLGIHSVGVDSAKSPLRGSALAAATHNANSHIGEYLHDMGIDAALFAAANAVPHNSVRFLQRDELVRLGIDTREFGETGWRLVAKPTAAVVKTYFARTENEQLAYRNAIVRLGCGAGKTMSLVIGREVGASASISVLSHPMQIAVGGRRIDLSPGKAAAGGFDVRGANLPVDFFESIKDGSAIEISTVDADRKTGRSPAVTLTLDGFAAAFDKLRKSCDATLSVAAFEELKKRQLVVVVPPVWPDTWGGCGSGGATVSFSSRRAAVLSTAEECALKPEDIFKECADCPEMLVVPTGSFAMGSPESENGRYHDEGPQHRVAFTRPFAVGKFAVTFDEWDACASDGGCNAYQPADQGWGRNRRPVINVSWDDANAYVAWLSRRTGKTYRLLSEAEREYVTRAGTTGPFWWGSSISPQQANYGGQKNWNQTLPVDSFQPNRWGLYQVHGNVFEWTQDCYHEGFTGAPSDGSTWTSGDSGDCRGRVVRGGSWDNFPRYLRSASRLRLSAGYRYYFLGFRVARTLTP